MLCSPVISNVQVTRTVIDGGAGLNILSVETFDNLQVSYNQLQPTKPFSGVTDGSTVPIGQVRLPVTFGQRDNYRTELIDFDVAHIRLPYNAILGYPALAKFMAASHYAYNTLKMRGPLGVLTIPSDEKDAIICVDKMYRDAVIAEAAAAAVPAKENKGKKRDYRTSEKESGKRAPSECMAPVDDMSECSNSKRSKVAAPQVKKVLARLLGIDGTFTISATLDDK